MPVYRVVWEFNENNGSTFSEVYYKESTTAELAARVPTALQAARLNLLHPLNTFVRSRTSNADGARETFTRTYNLPGTLDTNAGPLPPGAAIVCTLTGATGGTRKLSLRGTAQSFYLRNAVTGRDEVLPGLQTALDTFFAKLQTGGYGLRQLSPVQKNPVSPYAKNPIVSVNGTAGNGTSVITYTNPIVYAAGNRIVIGGTNKKDVPSLNGHFTILAQAGLTLTIAYQTPNAATILTAGGYLRLETYSAVSVFAGDACGFDHMGTRDTKSPLARSRGARRAARLRLSR